MRKLIHSLTHMIKGVGVYPRKKICTDQGCVYKWVGVHDPFFEKFGEIYFSSILPGVIKGWNVQTISDTNMICIIGAIHLVLYDRRIDSPTHGMIQEVVISNDVYDLVHIPYGVAFSWKAMGEHEAFVGNLATETYTPEELIKIDAHTGEIPYQWL